MRLDCFTAMILNWKSRGFMTMEIFCKAIAITCAALMAVLFFSVMLKGETCRGELVFSHNQVGAISVGGNIMINTTPIYTCKASGE
jgi:hypothetical protein